MTLGKIKKQIVFSDYDGTIYIKEENMFKDDVKAHSGFPGMYYNDCDYAIVDIVSKNAGKENAIKKILDILNIEKGQVVTIGDGRNDIEMIKEYNGYSMETEEEDVKKSASKIFESIADALGYLRNVL